MLSPNMLPQLARFLKLVALVGSMSWKLTRRPFATTTPFGIGTALLLLVSGPSAVNAQDILPGNPLISRNVKMPVDSGLLYHNGKDQEVIWQETVTVDDALWIRLRFKQLVLAGSPLGGASSTLRITSLTDGSFQLLDAKSAVQWRNTSAYFNGNAVQLELFAVPNGRLNLIVLDEVISGEPAPPDVTSTICDDIDDRILSTDPRVGRTAPGGCTGWLFNDRNNCMLTAGHCAPSTEVMLFNVPLSTQNGNPQFPGPEDQYAVDFSSFQAVNGGTGNDWGYFGCFPNSTTGLTAFETQGDSFQLATPPEILANDMIRITGFGSTSFPVDPTWDGAQKTQVGLYSFVSLNQLSYRTDTTGGNSGSPVIYELTGEAIGIHTHGGCGSGGFGANNGTASTQPGLANALENPLGICIVTAEFTFPDGLPETVNPNGTDTVIVNVDDSEFAFDTGSGLLHVDMGMGFQSFPMASLGKSSYEATFPASPCGTVMRYYFSITTLDGKDKFTSPTNAPNGTHNTLSAFESAPPVFDDDFEMDQGWSVSGTASDGLWERAIPAGGGDRGDPPTDADGSGNCYVTDNADGNSDVDNGTSILTSPVFDAATGPNEVAILSYYRWLDNGGEGDQFVIEISNDSGMTWTILEQIGDVGTDNLGGWFLKVFPIGQFIQPTSQMRLRFTVSDLADQSIVEAGVDGVSVQVIECEDEKVLLGDTNLDGEVNLLDVASFVALIENEQFQQEGDINNDGVVDLLDVPFFVQILVS